MFSDDIFRYAQHDENTDKFRDRILKTNPNLQQMVLMDLERRRINQIYERRRHLDITGPGGIEWQYAKALQRLKTNEQDIKRYKHDLTKMSLLPSISQLPLFYSNHAHHLPSIAEENSSLPIIEQSKSIQKRASSTNLSKNSLNCIKLVQTRSSMNKINFDTKHSHSLCKQYFQQVIAQTSDDRPYLQKHAHLINQQKRLIEQKLKDFLN